MEQRLTNIYRNESCRQLAEKVARGSAAESLNVTIKIDCILKNKPDLAGKVNECIAEQKPFILYGDQQNYYMILPKFMATLCYKNGKCIARSHAHNLGQFANNIRIAIAAYDNIYIPSLELQSGFLKLLGK